MFLAALDVPTTVESVDHVVDEARGVVVRVHREPGASGPLPCLFSIHGGGYVMGTRLMDDPMHRAYCGSLGIVGASVEYRLSPETPYPGPLEDCYDGLAWVMANAADLGIDPDRVGIYGGSAGGGLAAGLALLVRDRDEFDIAFQTLICPMLDDRQITPSSQLEGLDIWSRDSNEFGWRAYLGPRYADPALPIYAAPARAKDLSRLPPAYIAVGTIDGFRDEDVDYATRLNQAGVPCELHVYPGGPHGYQMFPFTEMSQQSALDVTRWLRRQLARLQP
ncbi:MAG: alpha/beta hydrolase [Ilumatobacteraceae bacterium]